MQLSDQTLKVLKHYAKLNDSIVVKPGKRLTVVASSGSVVATAEVPDEFQQEFAIGDIPQFVGLLSLIGTGLSVEVDGKSAIVAGNGRELRYTLADKTIVSGKCYPKKLLEELPDTSVEFKVSRADLTEILKASSILSTGDAVISGENGALTFKAVDPKNPTSSSYAVTLGEYSGKPFYARFKVDTLQMLPSDYCVGISSRLLAKWVGDEVTYWVALDRESKV